RQPDADRIPHQADHPLRLLGELAVELGDRRRAGLQDRIAELHDQRERGAAPLQGLLVEALRLAALDRLLAVRLLVELVDRRPRPLVPHGFESSPRPAAYCGSTPTEIASSRSARLRTAVATASRTAVTVSCRRSDLISSRRRCLPRRRKSGAGPS